jgi:hypothetical protein
MLQAQAAELATLRYERNSLQVVADGAQASLTSCMAQLADLRGTHDATLAQQRADASRCMELQQELAALQVWRREGACCRPCARARVCVCVCVFVRMHGHPWVLSCGVGVTSRLLGCVRALAPA